MVKFTATTLEGAGNYEGQFEDLGLCLVSKFIIDGVEFYSVVSQNATVEERVKNDDEAAAQYGYKIDIHSARNKL